MTFVEIGNDKAIEGYRDPNSDDPEKVRYRPLPGQHVTRVVFPEDMALMEQFTSAVNLIAYHVAEGASPAWIDSNSESLETLLKDHFSISTSRPRTWGKDTGADKLPRMSDLMALCLAPVVLAAVMLNLRTNAGRDWQANVMGGGGLAGAGTGAMRTADYIGVTNDTTAPDVANTTLPGEVTTGTLARAQAAFAHTNGTATYTLTKTFSSDQTITVAKMGVFNASTGGTLVFETLLNAVAPLVSGDQLAITETITL